MSPSSLWSRSVPLMSPNDKGRGKHSVASRTRRECRRPLEAAKCYYSEFKAQQMDLPPDRRLKIGTIYSYAANEDVGDDYLDEEGFETNALDQSSREFLDQAISDIFPRGWCNVTRVRTYVTATPRSRCRPVCR